MPLSGRPVGPAAAVAFVATSFVLLLTAVSAARPQWEAALRPDGGGGGSARQPPEPPSSFAVNYTLTLPYTAVLQQPPLSYPVAFYRDARSGRQRMELYDGETTMVASKVREQGGRSSCSASSA